MMLSQRMVASRRVLRLVLVALLAPLAAAGLSGCIVAGVSSSGGAFIWPGGLGLLVVIAIVFFLIRRR